MDLDHDSCYTAVLSRDRRFDGRFFTAVRTTGIYCRPVCPARPPRRENVRFYACAAAAEEAGFRPCKRCRPESSPGSPAWIGTSATLARAVRLIERGALDDGSIEDLAARLGIGGRHLRRLFLEQLGVAPVALALTRRLHLARRLLVETDLPVIEVALGAGFRSLRRFNDAFAKAYGAAPTALRRQAAAPEAGTLRLVLRWREPYDAGPLLAFLAPRAIPGVEHVEGSTYRRTIRAGDRAGVITVSARPERGGLELTVPPALARDLHHIVPRVREIFDLEAPVDRIADRLARDPLLGPSLARDPGLRLPGSWDPFELAVRAVLGQQVSVAAATTLAGRLVSWLGEPLPEAAAAHGVTHLFPGPATVAAHDLRRIGLPGRRAGSLSALARAVAAGDLSLEGKDSVEETVAALRALPGIGDWTAHYIAMRGLGEPDAFPAGDLGLRKAVGGAGGKATEGEVEARAEGWRPFRAYGAMHLWRSL